MSDTNQTILNYFKVSTERDFARDFQLRVLNIQPGDGSSVAFTEDDLVYIKAAELPGIEHTVHAQPYMGMPFRVPGNTIYNNEAWNISFLCDQNSNIRRLLEEYHKDIFDTETSTGNYFMPRANSIIDLVQLDMQLKRIAQYQLVGAFPTKIGSLQYNMHEGNGKPISFDVTFAYQFWRRVDIPQ